VKTSHARTLLAIIAAYWPTPAFSPETRTAWASLLEKQRFGLEDGTNAVLLLAERSKFRPAISEIVVIANEEWGDRMRRETAPSLPAKSLPHGISFAQFLHDNPDMAERVKALDDRKPGSPTNPIREALAGLLREGL
jgi:hypothetical protein